RLQLRRQCRAHRDLGAAFRPAQRGHRHARHLHPAELARADLRQPRAAGRAEGGGAMNLTAIHAIYRFEMARWWRTFWQSIVSPVLSTSLYFVVFGAAIGSRMEDIGGVSYGAFIVPGLIMMTMITQAIAVGSFGIYFPKFVGTIYELLSAPVSAMELVVGYVGAAATKAVA